MKRLKPAQAKRKKTIYIYIYIFFFSFVEIHAQANSTILLTNITSPTNIIPISLSADFHSEKMEVKHPKYITPQILSQLVADPRIARDKFVFDSVIILYY